MTEPAVPFLPELLADKPAGPVLQALFATARNLGYPFALFRLPHEDRPEVIIQFRELKEVLQPQLDAMPAGFLVHAFIPERPALFLEAHWHLQFSSSWSNPQLLRSTALPEADEEAFTATFIKALEEATAAVLPPQPEAVSENAPEQFTDAVALAVAAMQAREFQKVVLSRQKPVVVPPGFQPTDTWQSLARLYPHAFVSLISLAEQGVWLGATPELLLHEQPGHEFRTVALAGTQVAGERHERDAKWTQKEIEEQALVSRYIINCFKHLRVREFTEEGPRTIRAGHLLHLQTSFHVDYQQVQYPGFGSAMLELLHPTSAVCGMPREQALHFLTQHEHYHRQLYSGYLGPVNRSGHTDLFVNLRCLQLYEGLAILYIGAGLTQDSVPEKEWQETELKAETLLKVLG